MANVIVFANQKGGVAKTTTTLNLGVALHEMGKRVLVIDLDPQGNLTMSQGMNPDAIERSMFDVLVHRVPISDVIHTVEVDIAVASIDLAGAELALSALIGRERALEKALVEVRDRYDYILIDTPPSLGLLTINAFVAADGVIVPVQCEYLSLRGLVQLENTLAMVRENLNPRVHVQGIVPDDVRRPDAARARGDRDPRGALRRPRLQDPHPQDHSLRGGPREGKLGSPLRPVRPGGTGLPRPREGGARWRASARRCVRARSPSSSARPRLRSASRTHRPSRGEQPPSPRPTRARRRLSRRRSSTYTTSRSQPEPSRP